MNPSRRVDSGSYPLYRMIMLSSLISACMQIITGRVPGSVDEAGGLITDVAYLAAQIIGCSLIIASFWIGRAWLSLQVERIGCLCAATNVGIYVVTVVSSSGMPVAAATWGAIAVGVYCAYRGLWEIRQEIKELHAVAREHMSRAE